MPCALPYVGPAPVAAAAVETAPASETTAEVADSAESGASEDAPEAVPVSR